MSLWLFAISLVLTADRPFGERVCLDPEAWILSGEYCYYTEGQNVAFDNATAACASLGSTLPRLTSSQHNADFANYSVNPAILLNTIWLDLTDMAVEGDFEWGDGTALSWSNWISGDPDNTDWPSGVEADCAAFRRQNFDWMDQKCDAHFLVICQKESVEVNTRDPSDAVQNSCEDMGDAAICTYLF